MITIHWLVLLIVLVIACFDSVYIYHKVREKNAPKNIGDLFVNPEEPADQGGVYAAFDLDPKEFSDGQQVYLNVKVVRK